MKLITALILSMMFLTSCATVNTSSGGVCRGLDDQVDNQADATLVFGDTLTELKENTPGPVVEAGEKLIVESGKTVAGFDKGCS